MSGPGDVLLDVRGLCAPEPMERVIDALAALPPGQRLQVLIDREPFPLYRMLERSGYLHQTSQAEDGQFLVLISEHT